MPEAAPGGGRWPDRPRIWIPRDLAAFIGFPHEGSQLTRVQTWSEQKTVTFTGYNAFRGFESLLARHGVTCRPGVALLDWGCGHGRVTRHFIQNWPQARISGADIDAENIGWAQQNLTGGQFLVAPLWPPLDVPGETFDAVIGLSVMTHLTADAQAAWLAEIHRILKPGGVALISFGGDGAAAFASIHHTPEWWARWREAGFDDGLLDPALEGKIADSSYYRVTHQSVAQVRAAWEGALRIEAIEPQAFGYQDIAVLRRGGALD
jgi:SAM-dependent methyltransferase